MPTLQHVVESEGSSRVAAAKPSLLGVVPPGSATDKAVAAASVLAAIPVPMETVVSEVTLAASPPPVVVEEARDTELPALPGGGSRGSPLTSEPKAQGEDVAGLGSGRPAVAQANEVVEIPSDDEADVTTERLVPLRQPAGNVTVEPSAPSRGLAEV